MAGAKRRWYKKKGSSRRRKSGYSKRKSNKKTRRVRRVTKKQIYDSIKAGLKLRRHIRASERRRAKGTSIGEMAFVVANYHPAPEAAINAAAVHTAINNVASQMSVPSSQMDISTEPPNTRNVRAREDYDEEDL